MVVDLKSNLFNLRQKSNHEAKSKLWIKYASCKCFALFLAESPEIALPKRVKSVPFRGSAVNCWYKGLRSVDSQLIPSKDKTATITSFFNWDLDIWSKNELFRYCPNFIALFHSLGPCWPYQWENEGINNWAQRSSCGGLERSTLKAIRNGEKSILGYLWCWNILRWQTSYFGHGTQELFTFRKYNKNRRLSARNVGL